MFTCGLQACAGKLSNDVASAPENIPPRQEKEFVMKTLCNLTAGAAFLLIAASPAVGQTFLPYASGPPLHLAAGSFDAKKDAYMQKAKTEMLEWQQKLKDFGETADARGQEAATATKNGLQLAWSKTQAESRKLETASAEGWESAKSSYEKASQSLKDSWRKSHPEGK
jgi:hypothetical protein